jgi:hypothetical protein
MAKASVVRRTSGPLGRARWLRSRDRGRKQEWRNNVGNDSAEGDPDITVEVDGRDESATVLASQSSNLNVCIRVARTVTARTVLHGGQALSSGTGRR